MRIFFLSNLQKSIHYPITLDKQIISYLKGSPRRNGPQLTFRATLKKFKNTINKFERSITVSITNQMVVAKNNNSSDRKEKMASLKQSSRGGHHLFHQQKKLKSEKFECSDVSSPIEVIQILTKGRNCCLRGRGRGGCVWSYFSSPSIRANEAIEFFTKCRSLIAAKTKEEKEEFLFREFCSCVKGNIKEENGEIKLQMDYRGGVNREVPLCRNSFALVYNTSKHTLDKFSRKIRSNDGSTRVSSHNLHRYTDSTLHAMTYNETQSLFVSEVPDFNILQGKILPYLFC